MKRAIAAAVIGVLCAASAARGDVVGWRQNWTGRFPEATPPLTWSRTPKGIATQLRCQAGKPGGADTTDAKPLMYGVISDFLVLASAPADAGEANLQPDTGAKLGDAEWKVKTVVDPVYASNLVNRETQRIDPAWTDFGQDGLGAKGQPGFAHTYLYAPKAGTVTVILDHTTGIKVYVNGKVVYDNPKPAAAFHYRHNRSEQKMVLNDGRSPRFNIELNQGWNRLLFRLSDASGRFNPRISDPPDVTYEDKNIAWVTKLPGYGIAGPVVVGDRIFVLAEPDELVCVDKKSGKILWRRLNGYFEAATAEEKSTAVYKEKVAPLVEKLKVADDYDERLVLRRGIQDGMTSINKDKYEITATGHFSVHYDIAGWTGNTPVSDGKYVYVNFSFNVAACYDIDGNRQWISFFGPSAEERASRHGEVFQYPCAPVLVDGKFIVAAGPTIALDAKTGAVLWKSHGSMVAITPATLAGQSVLVLAGSHIIRTSNGKSLYVNEGRLPKGGTSDYGWAPPIVEGTTVFLPWYGYGALAIYDFSGAKGDQFDKPPQKWIDGIPMKPGERWKEAQSGASPLYVDGLLYCIDMSGNLYVLDAAKGVKVHMEKLDMDAMIHCNAVGCGACPTLGGKSIYFMNNLGTTIVMEPGTFKTLAKNQITTIVQRRIPINPVEIVSYANPVFDGKRVFIRGEENLYCIGEK